MEHRTFCPYKGLCSYYDIGEARVTAWSYREAYDQVGRINDLVSFEPDIVSVQLDGVQLRLAAGQTVIPHGPDRDLDVPTGTGKAALGESMDRLIAVNVGFPRDFDGAGQGHLGGAPFEVTQPHLTFARRGLLCTGIRRLTGSSICDAPGKFHATF